MADINQNYKLRHKPHQHSDKVKYYQGYYKPINPEKWITQIIEYRSGWEFKFCRWADMNPNVLKVASEPIGIKYLDPVGNLEYCMKYNLNPNDPHNWKERTYYTDFWIELKDDSKPEGVKRIFIEIKPDDQAHAPAPLSESATLKEHKAYNKAALTYLTNQAKWSAAKKYFEERGAEFMVVTEKVLSQLGLL